MSKLFEPLTVRGVTLRNRIGMSPMCQYSAIDGRATDWHEVHLPTRAAGGAGLIIVEATAVTAQGRISPGDAGLWTDEQIPSWRRVAQLIKQNGAVPAVQLAHAGRKASSARPWDGSGSLVDDDGGWETIAPTAEAFGGKLWRVPREMTIEDIHAVQKAFQDAATRAIEAGFEWLELHGAHGYLHNCFLSPLSNRREDAYGGSLENRMRFTLETAVLMRQVMPDTMPLAVRLSATEWHDDGWTLDDSVILSQHLKQVGVDLIDCSSTVAPGAQNRPNFDQGWQVPLAKRIKKEADILTAAVGGIHEPAFAESVVAEERADVVLLGRALLNDPYWPYHTAVALGEPLDKVLPTQYSFWMSRYKQAK
jgi:2,4-dienoyl-CoA reductase-like NADH-dependent reductase (Old Yellow Enzyme family)